MDNFANKRIDSLLEIERVENTNIDIDDIYPGANISIHIYRDGEMYDSKTFENYKKDDPRMLNMLSQVLIGDRLVISYFLMETVIV